MQAVIIPRRVRLELGEIGRLRNGAKDPSWTRRRSDVFSDAEVDELGLYGEYAVADFLGVDFDRRISVGGDGGVDFVWRGRELAVKYNHRWLGYLVVEERAGDDPGGGVLGDLSAEIIVGTHGKCSRGACYCRGGSGVVVAFSGWLYREEFIGRMRRVDWGLGGRYYVDPKGGMRPMRELFDLRVSGG